MTVADRKKRSAAQVEGIPKPSQLYHGKLPISEEKKTCSSYAQTEQYLLSIMTITNAYQQVE